MRSVRAALLVAGLTALTPTPQSAVIESDGWRLHADEMFPPGDGRVPVVLLLHGAAGSREDYRSLGAELVARGIGAVRVDLRAHGESVNQGTFDPDVAATLSLLDGSERDVLATLAWLRSHPRVRADAIGVVSVSYSGEAAAIAVRADGTVKAMVALSPGSLSDASLDAIDPSGVPWLLVRAELERAFFDDLFAEARRRSRTAEIRVLAGRSHATRLLNDNPTLNAELAVWLARKLSVREQMLAVNGTELFVKRMGDGTPVIVVHGGPMLDHGYLLPHLEPLADDHELIFFDQRLNGRSAGRVDPDSVRLDTFVDDIEAIRVALGLGPVHLVAHSFGGLQAMSYAVRHGAALRSLVLLDSMAASAALWRQEEAALGGLVSDEERAEAAALRASDGVAARQPAALAELLRLSFSWQFHDRSMADRLRLFVPSDYAERSAQFGAIMADLEAFDLHEALEAVPTPTLLLYGDLEPGGPLGGAAIDARLPDSELVIIEGAGHFPFVERPDEVIARIGAFLAER